MSKLTREEIIKEVSKISKALIRKSEFETEPKNANEGGNYTLNKSADLSAEEKDFQRHCDSALHISKALTFQAGYHIPVTKTKFWNDFKKNNALYGKFVKASMQAGTAGFGLEWSPAGFSPDITRIFDLNLMVANLFRDTTIPMAVKDLTLNRVTTTAGSKLIAEAGTITPARIGTGKYTLTPQKHVASYAATDEINEDSIVAVVDEINSAMGRDLARGVEDAIINGDDSGTHQDTDSNGSDDVRKSWKGLRKLTLTASKIAAANVVLTSAFLDSAAAVMGKYGVDPANLVWIAGPNTYQQMIKLDQFTSLEKYGSAATRVTGELGRANGKPVVVSEFIREDLNASGVQDGVTTDRTHIMLVFTPGFRRGTKRQVTVEFDKDILTQENQWVASMRSDFKASYDDTTQAIVANIIDLAKLT